MSGGIYLPAEAAAARRAVVARSVRCAGQGCLQRSLATALLCRLHGTWPTWCTGVRIAPFHALMSVGPSSTGQVA